MKIERLLLGLFASFLMVGCSQNDDSPNAGEEAKGKDSYISIKINADMSGSRATPTFSAGSAVENDVNSVHFFFFDEDGNAFNVPIPEETTADGGSQVVDGIDEDGSKFNWIKINDPVVAANSTANEGANVNVEKILDAIVVFKVQNNTYPSQIIAVLNWNYNGTVALNKSSLMQQLIDEATAIGKPAEGATSQENTGFIMSNSVYMGDAGVTIDAKSISEANFATTPTDAKKDGKTIKLHVERVAVKVKVDVNKSGTATDYVNTGTTEAPIHAFKVAEAPNIYGATSGNETPIYAQILAWDLNTTNSQSYLVKQLGTGWNETTPYEGWNDATNFRSYYANAYSNGTYNKSFTWGGIGNAVGGSDYCLENTNASNATKVVVKARLVVANTENGSTTYNPVTVCQWYSYYYVGIDALKAAVVKTVNVFEKGEGDNNYTKITAANINVNAKYQTGGNAYDAYKVTFSVSTTASDNTTKTWYKREGSEGSYTYTEYTDVNAQVFSNLPDAKVWQHGATYYFTDVKHENNASAVIRNHVYDVSIEGVNGLGTPVYYPSDDPGTDPNPDPTDEPEIPEPVVPEETETYIAAKVNVLSWKLVSNLVTLGQ